MLPDINQKRPAEASFDLLSGNFHRLRIATIGQSVTDGWQTGGLEVHECAVWQGNEEERREEASGS